MELNSCFMRYEEVGTEIIIIVSVKMFTMYSCNWFISCMPPNLVTNK